MKNLTRRLLTLAVFGSMAVTFAQPTAAQTANRLSCDGCVNSKHLKNNVIRSSDVKNGSLTGRDLRNGTVGSAVIKDNSLTGVDLRDGSVGSADITDSSLTGADLQDGTVGLADLAAGVVSADTIFARTLMVSPVGDGSDATANGLALLDAIAFLGGVSPAPGATNPWVIRIEPGIYDVGTTGVVMLPFVDIEGSGEKTTQITGSVDGFSVGVVRMASDTEIRHITVINTGGGGAAEPAAIGVDGTRVSIAHVTAMGFDGTSKTSGINLDTNCAESVLVNVTAVARTNVSGGTRAVQLSCDGTNEVTNLTATAAGGAGNFALFAITTQGLVTARNSTLTGDTASVESTGGGTAVLIASQLNGPVLATASVTCIGSFDGAFNELDEDCE